MQSKDYSHTEEASWLAPTVAHAVSGTVRIPGSKSLSNRELVLSALAASESELVDLLDSRDTSLMIRALETLGTQIKQQKGITATTIIPATTDIAVSAQIDCGLAGTVMRFMPPVAALFKGEISFDGDEAARKRPMQTTIDSLRGLGVTVEDSGSGFLPFTIQSNGEVDGGYLEIDASASSQFVSGLLLAAPRFTKGLTLKHVGPKLPSLPHIDMTVECLRNRGITVTSPEENTWVVEPGVIQGKTVVIEPDLSNAGPFMAAAMVAGGTVKIEDWPEVTTQVGSEFISILSQMGANIAHDGQDLVVRSGSIRGIEIDMSKCGELVPVIAALAVLADSPTKITGISHIRGHETDRISALVHEINNIGGNAKELEDGIEIQPSDKLHGGQWTTYGDHRMATAAAIIGLAVPEITVLDINVVNKTMPEFVSLWNQMLGLSN
jgi:3-phosphoshikimate 1-carboxyvinyltransferase